MTGTFKDVESARRSCHATLNFFFLLVPRADFNVPGTHQIYSLRTYGRELAAVFVCVCVCGRALRSWIRVKCEYR